MSRGVSPNWSNKAISNYQRARSSDITITHPDGTTSLLTRKQAMEARKDSYKARAAEKRRPRVYGKKKRRPSSTS